MGPIVCEDKSGRQIVEGDYIIYATKSGNCPDFAYAIVLGVDNVNLKIKVRSTTWTGRLSTLTALNRTLIVSGSQLSATAFDRLNEGLT